MPELRIFGIEGIGEVAPGDDLAGLILDAIDLQGEALDDGDVVVVTHKVVSKQEGRVVTILDEESYRDLVEDEAHHIIRRRGDLVITQTRHGFICANAAVDRSNVEAGHAVLLPVDPDRSAHRLRSLIERRATKSIGVIVTDGVSVIVKVAVSDGVFVNVDVGVNVGVGVNVWVDVAVGVKVNVGVQVGGSVGGPP